MNQQAAETSIVDVSLATFEEAVLRRSHTVAVLVDFRAAWCGPCRTVAPILEKLAAEYAGRMVLAKVDCDREQELAARWNVRGLPTMAVFRNARMVDQVVGAQPESVLRRVLETHLPGGADGLAQEAAELLAAGDTARAVDLLREALSAQPDSTPVRLQLAGLLTVNGNEDEAAEILDGVRIEDQASTGFRAERARIEFARLAREAPPQAELEMRIESDPGDSEARHQLAARNVMGGSFEPAMAQLLEIVRRDRGYGDDAGRRALVSLFQLLPRQDPLVTRYRGLLAQAIH